MLLQPLVENAIRHGLEPKVAGGRITVSAQKQGERLRIAVADDGLGFGETPGDGIGVRNVRDRLAALYGAAARLELSSGVGAGVTATMSIPLGMAA
jgi:sensor histidine kinase YesM